MAGKSFKSMIENYIEWDCSTVKQSIKKNIFEDYKEYFEMLIKGERYIIIEDFKLKEGGLWMSLIHELVLHDNKDFLNFTLDLFKQDIRDSIKQALLSTSNLTQEINQIHQMSGLTPFTALCANGLSEHV